MVQKSTYSILILIFIVLFIISPCRANTYSLGIQKGDQFTHKITQQNDEIINKIGFELLSEDLPTGKGKIISSTIQDINDTIYNDYEVWQITYQHELVDYSFDYCFKNPGNYSFPPFFVCPLPVHSYLLAMSGKSSYEVEENKISVNVWSNRIDVYIYDIETGILLEYQIFSSHNELAYELFYISDVPTIFGYESIFVLIISSLTIFSIILKICNKKKKIF